MVQLNLTDRQAKIAARACEFYTRIVLGQFNEIILELVNDTNIDSVVENRQEIESLLFKARDLIYPDLHGRGHSYGVGEFEHADKSYDVYQAIRSLFGDTRTPFSYYTLPAAKHYEDKSESYIDVDKRESTS